MKQAEQIKAQAFDIEALLDPTTTAFERCYRRLVGYAGFDTAIQREIKIKLENISWRLGG